jgi:hypothetical protein
MPVEIEVPTEHLHESLKEAHEHHAKHGAHPPDGDHEGGEGPSWIGKVALSAAVLAVTAAVSALLAGHHANEAMLEQMKATDQWSYYQAKGIKMSQIETKLSILDALGKGRPPEDEAKLHKYEKDQEGIKEKATEMEQASEKHMEHHVRLARSVTAFQVAIAACAIAVLSKRKLVWSLGLVLGALGAVFFVLGLI